MPAGSFRSHIIAVAAVTNLTFSKLDSAAGDSKIVKKSSYKSFHKAC
jgi:hypothetical protein